jgi:protein SCO1
VSLPRARSIKRSHSEKAGSTGVAPRDLTVMNARPGRHNRLLLYLLFSGTIWQLAGCGANEPPADLKAPTAASTASPEKKREKGKRSTDYQLKGVVKKVDLARGSVTIAHEAIPGFMGAMTMPFFPTDRGELEGVAFGDEVEATLHVDEQDGVVSNYELRSLVVTKPAVSEMVLDVTKGKVSVRKPPKQLEVGEPVPDFSMTTQEGKPLKLSDLRGSVVVLTFIYTRCPLPDFCPLMDRKFGELAQRLNTIPDRAAHVRLISVSFDPEHDTPLVLAKHAQARGATPPLWIFAVAKHEELSKVGRPLGLFYGPRENDIAHNLSTAIIDPQGKLARLEVGTERNKWENVDLLKTIYSLIPPSAEPRKP